MSKIVQCIPNFSEGKNITTIKKLIDVAKSTAGVTLVDHSSDENHNRSVFTLIGSPEGVEEVLVKLSKIARDNIDMTKHFGKHPRMGSTDVIALVPIKNITMEETVKLSEKIGERIYNELEIPVMLYANSAKKENRINLANIRKGEFEGMSKKLLEEKWTPDFGENKIHPTAGITAIGARSPMIAFNVNLNTNNLEIANNIARIIRGSSGGFKNCKAIGLLLEDKNIVQVSINMMDYNKLPLYRIFEIIKLEAKKYGVTILESEIIGLTPGKALVDSAIYYLQMNNFDYNTQVLENYLFD
ncbi:glutamate formimidoyltransferase [Miniphocaeibacter halophilus]|uniref:Glutamate formimidoyltransferase n=1 Tax=Miniphocaeibacter halophilus TaxID=2931922 RepID=A0AC61MS39_9FIRM|nr:glutamate formimidoyltransferase [Miniphocaeibacter halophilus]QQK08252.1 glutamate formimidoyltransferase [Miniphocaeibacter halophilus]